MSSRPFTAVGLVWRETPAPDELKGINVLVSSRMLANGGETGTEVNQRRNRAEELDYVQGRRVTTDSRE